MKKLYLLSLILFSCYLANAQKQFSDKQQAYSWLQNAFAKYFIKTEVSLVKTADILKYQNYMFDYSFNENYLLISYNEEDFLNKKNYHFLLIPFNKISEITIGKTTPYFNQSTHITISSECRCFKLTDGKKFKGEANADYLKDIQIIPFNVNDEPEIGTSLKNAFAVLSGNQSQQAQNNKIETAISAKRDKFILKVNAEDISKAKAAYANIAIPTEKNDLETLGMKGKVKSVKTMYNDIIKDSTGKEAMKFSFSTFSVFNPSGKLLSTLTTENDGSTRRQVNIYNNKEMLLYTLNPEDSVATIECTYTKGANGNNIKNVISVFGSTLYTYTYANTELISSRTEDKDSTKPKILKYKTKYDNFKNILSQDGYLDDVLKSHFQYTYNSKNCMTSAEHYEDGELISKNTMRYDDKNRLVETSDVYKNISFSVNKYEQYDENGNPTKYKSYSDGNLKWVIVREINYY